MIRISVITSFCLLVTVSARAACQSTYADFEAYRSAMQGRWIGDVTWIADWPGLGKKGDKTTAHFEMRSAADGRVLIGTFYGGAGSGLGITIFDAASGEIRELGSDSGGSSWQCVISRRVAQWVSRCTGSLADGTPTTGENTLTISDNGNTHRWRGRTTVGGVETDALQDVWRRVSR